MSYLGSASDSGEILLVGPLSIVCDVKYCFDWPDVITTCKSSKVGAYHGFLISDCEFTVYFHGSLPLNWADIVIFNSKGSVPNVTYK